jgi:hypothetical protein
MRENLTSVEVIVQKPRRRPAPIIAALSLTRRDVRVLRAKLQPIAQTDRDVAALMARLQPVGGDER